MTEANSQKLIMVPVSQLVSSSVQPRLSFDEEEIMALAESIREVGLLQPPLVKKMKNGLYEIIAGERRVLACRYLKLSKIAVHLANDLTEEEKAKVALIENVQRVDLNPIEVAKALEQMMKEYDLTQEALSQSIGKKRSTVANFLRLLQLPESIQESLTKGEMSMAHAKLLLSSPKELQERFHQMILFDKVSVKELERSLKNATSPRTITAKTTPPEDRKKLFLDACRKEMEDALGTKVEVISDERGGKVVIHFYDDEGFNGIYESIKNSTPIFEGV